MEVLARKQDLSPHRANACWSIAVSFVMTSLQHMGCLHKFQQRVLLSSLRGCGLLRRMQDLSMEPAWRAEVGGKSELLEHLMMLLFEGDLYEKKNAALCFGNLCCDWYGPGLYQGKLGAYLCSFAFHSICSGAVF